MTLPVRRSLAVISLGLAVLAVAGCKSASMTSHGNRRLAGTNAPPGVMFFADTPDKRPVLKVHIVERDAAPAPYRGRAANPASCNHFKRRMARCVEDFRIAETSNPA